MEKDWIVNPAWSDRDVAAGRWGVSPLVAQVMYNRGVGLADDHAGYLSPQLADLFPPDMLPGCREAAVRIAKACCDGERIVIYGDYDVDGMTSVAILWRVLTLAGANVSFYIPHRLEEGYGINVEAIQSLIADGARLIVSVDCGVTAVEAARVARESGVELIVTDHHQAGAELPVETIMVHPGLDGTYPNPDLCGAGVAFKLAWAIAQELSGSEKVTDAYRIYLRDALSLAALGTIADVVPLIGENRIIARHGLALIPRSPFVGLQALIESAGLAGSRVSSYDVGFKLAPRLNAVGRMGHARLGVELLTRATADRAREIALYLQDQNRARQSTERKFTIEAKELAEKSGMTKDSSRAIVLAREGWHAGVIGIVASRLVDAFHRPTVMIALDNGSGQGSARSVPNFHMTEALSKCGEHLRTFGGHAQAAGLRIDTDRVGDFTEQFIDHANNTLTHRDLREKLRLDAEVRFGDLDMSSTEALLGLGPFGHGHSTPRFTTDWVDLAAEPRVVGKTGSHLQATFSDGRSVLKAIAFGKGKMIDDLKQHRRCKVAFEPMINEFNGRRTVEMQVIDLQFSDLQFPANRDNET